MKKFCVIQSLLVLAFSLASVNARSQGITTPRTSSPAASVSQTIGISTVTVRYSRPSVKGREVWGALVPYGWNVQSFGASVEAPWRAGANENTVIELSHAAKIEGKEIPAGSYGLFFVINKDNTGEVVLSKNYRSWGSYWYDPKEDVLRSKISVGDIPHTEMLTFDFINVGKNSAQLVLNWEKKQFPVSIEFAVDDIVIANAIEELRGPAGFTWQGFSSAANYTLVNKTHTEQGLKWIDQALAGNRSFTTLSTKAGLLNLADKKTEAEETMKSALAIATEAELNGYGYQLIAQGEYDKAIDIFTLNTERFPASPNTWDSLGEGYAIKGDKKNAIKNFKKCLSMNPPANVKANSEKFLKQFGEM